MPLLAPDLSAVGRRKRSVDELGCVAPSKAPPDRSPSLKGFYLLLQIFIIVRLNGSNGAQ